MTLIEVLATLTLLSIIGILVWSVFIQGMKNTNDGAMKTRLTQEMNYVQAQLRKIHLNSDEYTITSPTNCNIQVDYIIEEVSTTLLFEDNQICYEITDKVLPLEIYPKRKDESFLIMLSDKNNVRNNVTIQTNLSRLKEE